MIRSRRRIVLAIIPFLPWLAAAVPAAAQKVETVDGVRVVHNIKGGLWGKTPRGSPSSSSARSATSTPRTSTSPSTIRPTSPSDKDGNIYILDTGNTRIQKFGPDGEYLATIGRKGQGPGEFIMPGRASTSTRTATSSSPIRPRTASTSSSAAARTSGPSSSRTKGPQRHPAPRLRRISSAGPRPTPSRGAASPAEGRPNMRLFRRIGAGRADRRRPSAMLTDFGEPMTNAMGNASDVRRRRPGTPVS